MLAVAIFLSVVAAGDGTLPGDIAIQRFVQRAPQPPARWLADFGNWIGSARVFVVIAIGLALLLSFARKRWEMAILLTALATRALNGVLKIILDSPRPSADLVRVTENAQGLGFPSGHAMGSMLGYGAIAIVASRLVANRTWRRIAQITCAVIVLLVGFGRIYVGAHWPSDVLGGYLWGAILLMAVYAAVTTIQRIVSRN